MGLDVSGYLVYGIILPKEFVINDDDTYYEEAIENLFYPYDKEKPYPNLEPVSLGSCDEPEILIAYKNHIHSIYWYDNPMEIDLYKLVPPKDIGELQDFCFTFNLECKPKWYLGCYSSY